MNTQGVNNQVSWAEFVRLTQQARIRNNGFSKEINRVNEVNKRIRTNPYNSVQNGMSKNISQTQVSAGAKTKISGGLFDAYA